MRRLTSCLSLVVGACAGPSVAFDVDAGPDAFWASCGEGARSGPRELETAADVAALEGVVVVDGDLVIRGATLDDLGALSSLRCVRGRLDVSENPRLPDLDGLEGLVAVEDSLTVHTNPSLTSIRGLSGLVFVGPFATDARVSIAGNAALTELSGLEGLTEIHGNLTVDADDALLDLRGLENVTRVAGDVSIARNASLLATDQLERLAVVEGQLVVTNNMALGTLALPSLVAVDELPHDITGIFRGLEIASNPALVRVELPALARTEDVDIQDNAALTTVVLPWLRALPAATRLTGNLLVTGPALTDVDLQGLESVDTDFHVGGDALERLSAPRLTTVGEDLLVGDDMTFVVPSTFTVSALELEALRSVGGTLTLHNTALDDLRGLAALESIGGDLVIDENVFLGAVALDALRTLGGTLEVRSNRLLPTCAVEALEAQLRAAGFTGRVQIAANDEDGVCR